MYEKKNKRKGDEGSKRVKKKKTYQVNHSIRRRIRPRLLDPPLHAEEALPTADVVDDDDAVGAAVVTS